MILLCSFGGLPMAQPVQKNLKSFVLARYYSIAANASLKHTVGIWHDKED